VTLDTKYQHKNNDHREKLMRHNASERENRARVAKLFEDLAKACSCVNSNRLKPSKRSILLAAKQECKLLRHFEKRIVKEKEGYRVTNKYLKSKLAKLVEQ